MQKFAFFNYFFLAFFCFVLACPVTSLALGASKPKGNIGRFCGDASSDAPHSLDFSLTVPVPLRSDYKTIPMGGLDSNGKHRIVKENFLKRMDAKNDFHYFNESERHQFRMKFGPTSGLVYDNDCKLISKGSSSAEYIYVMDASGQFYVAPEKLVGTHSAFLAGQPVASAGHLKIQQGQILYISGNSGHYEPSKEYLDQAIMELQLHGVFPQKIVYWDENQ